MNRLLRMLRLIMCLYLGSVVAAAWANEWDDKKDAIKVASHEITEAEAQARKAVRDEQDESPLIN